MNGNDPAHHPDLFDHEVRITRLEEAVKYLQHSVEEGFARMDRGFAEQREQATALRESMDFNSESMRLEFHRDRRFSAFIFLTTQLAVIGALLRLAGIL